MISIKAVDGVPVTGEPRKTIPPGNCFNLAFETALYEKAKEHGGQALVDKCFNGKPYRKHIEQIVEGRHDV